MMKGDSAEAYSYFASLSDLIRKSMKNAFEPYKTLGEEVDKSIIIPKMLIHLFVENAVKHGIFHQPNGGRIDVKIERSKKGIFITVTDDGVGMQKSFQMEKKQGDGLKILNNYLSIFNKKQKHSVHYEIRDRSHQDANLTGTRVLINIKLQRAR